MLTLMRSNAGIPKDISYSFGPNGTLIVLGVPILKLFRVSIGTHKFFSKWKSMFLDVTIFKQLRYLGYNNSQDKGDNFYIVSVSFLRDFY